MPSQHQDGSRLCSDAPIWTGIIHSITFSMASCTCLHPVQGRPPIPIVRPDPLQGCPTRSVSMKKLTEPHPMNSGGVEVAWSQERGCSWPHLDTFSSEKSFGKMVRRVRMSWNAWSGVGMLLLLGCFAVASAVSCTASCAFRPCIDKHNTLQ